MTAEAFRELELQLGRTYQLHDLLGHVPRLRIKVVGVFTKSDPRDLFWFGRFSRLSTSYLIDFATFERHFLDTEARNLTRAYWHYAVDYHELTIRDVPHVMRRYQDYVRLAAPAGVSFNFAIAPLLESYLLRAATLERTLSFLQIPSGAAAAAVRGDVVAVGHRRRPKRDRPYSRAAAPPAGRSSPLT